MLGLAVRAAGKDISMMHGIKPSKGALAWSACALTTLLAVSGCGAPGVSMTGRWAQWGGPGQQFIAPAFDLANQWPDKGPRQIWKRELGGGYSAILADGGRLYTMYRHYDNEIIIAMDAGSGETIWEHAYASPVHEKHAVMFGTGPRGTPLLRDGRIYAIGVSGKMHCLDASDGSVIWKHDLWKEFDATFLMHGYASSPIAYKDTIITTVGGEGHALVAFDANDGHIVWKSLDFGNSYSTPKLVTLDGRDHLLCFMGTEIIGVDPNNGKLEWQQAHENQWKQNVCMPVLGDDNYVLFSSPEVGSRGVRLRRNGDKVEVEDVWSARKIQFYHTTVVRIGDYIYGSSGTRTPCFFSAINIKTGEIAWRERGFAKATCVYADGKFIILDEDGNLAIATATPESFTVHSKIPLLEKVSWTVPTIVDQTLFVRDQKHIMALDLG
jgi:outer membrane protein assembly factor BamB